jgi:hypothetical protein
VFGWVHAWGALGYLAHEQRHHIVLFAHPQRLRSPPPKPALPQPLRGPLSDPVGRAHVHAAAHLDELKDAEGVLSLV